MGDSSGCSSVREVDLGLDSTPSTQLGSPSVPVDAGASCVKTKFVPSSIQRDAAQTTLPLLDIQEVAPQPATPLAGVGLYLKRQSGGGGFLGLRVTMPDLA